MVMIEIMVLLLMVLLMLLLLPLVLVLLVWSVGLLSCSGIAVWSVCLVVLCSGVAATGPVGARCDPTDDDDD